MHSEIKEEVHERARKSLISPRLKGGSYKIKVCLFVCLSVCLSVTGSKEHCRQGHELRDEYMVSGVIRYGESESGVSY